MQVKVKISRELKRYVSQNISSNSWNFTVNKVSVLAKFVFSQALLYLCNQKHITPNRGYMLLV